MAVIMSGTYNLPVQGAGISEVPSIAIINIKNASVTFAMADTNTVLCKKRPIHCSVQSYLLWRKREKERNTERGTKDRQQ